MHVNKADGVMFCMRLMDFSCRAKDDDADGACKYDTICWFGRLVAMAEQEPVGLYYSNLL